MSSGSEEGLDDNDVLEALIVTAIQELKKVSEAPYIKGFLQYEVDSLGSGGTYDVQRR